ncbi:MAG: MBL fold metallo-hydrolase [Firmicutes bacterium]|nr:MBL fold metallo-hydrolase [Bacillota bacterium]
MENVVTAIEVKERMARGETFGFIDVQDKGSFQNWQVKGMTLQAVNVPYFDFKENEVNDELLPENCCIVMISPQSATAKRVRSRFEDKGYDVVNLSGGRTVWHDFYLESVILTSSEVKLTQFHRLGTGCLSYFLVSGHEAIVVDPSRHIEQYLEAAARENVKITHVIDTHIHADHISGAQALLRETSADYLVAHSELHAHHLPVVRMHQGTTLHLSGMDMRVTILDTEGETQGNSLLEFDKQFVLSGDAIALGEVGIPDLTGNAQEWAEKLFNTVLRDVKHLPDDTLILPAHFGDIQAVNAGGYVGALLGDVRLGAQANATKNVLTFSSRPLGFVASLPKASDDIRQINAGLATLDGVIAADLELDLRE